MLRFKAILAMAMVFGILAGLGVSQAQDKNKKGKKEKKEGPSIDKLVEHDTFKDDLKIVRESGLTGQGPDILEYFKKRTLKAPDPKDIAALVKQLGDEDFNTREKAFTALVGMGAAALTGLKEGENAPDLEVRMRVADLKKRIDTKAEPRLQSAAARVLARLKTEGAADTLMAFLPFCNDPMVVDEICVTLGAVAIRNDKAEPVLVKALTDDSAIKRGAAGEALARANAKDEMANVKKLLQDKDVGVRYRVCLAMLSHKDKDIVPVMIDLLAELEPNQLWPIEEALLRLAGEKAPTGSLGNDAAARKNYRDAWTKWYTANSATLDMAKLTQDNVFLGYTLIVQANNRIGVGGGNNAEVFELDKDKKVRWKISVPGGQLAVVDAQVLPGNRVLVAEYQAGRVTERDHNGDVKWEYACGANPFQVQRLPNGNTFIAMQGRLIEIDRNKNEVWSYQRPNPDIQRARRLPNGEIVFVHHNNFIGRNDATCVRMEPRTQRIIKSFTVAPIQIIFGSIDVLPNGNVLIAHYNQQRVHEYDKDGQQVGNALNLNWPNSVVRLPNGNNLITSYNQRQVYEYRGNEQVWSYQTDGLTFVARRR